ncbi:MAG: hypothetical protein EPO35_00975 [Acidobacteria bacterium]|nr:MAG: hypothetical protein EPO35_00975 [Acidobacteriota bacterium]
MTRRLRSNRSHEEGAALILAVLFVLALSAVGSAMVVLSRTEVLSSLNYRMMSQSRYAAESGVHAAINHLLLNYPKPGTVGDPLANYDTTVSPVRFNGQPVVLSAATGVAANYPNAAAQTAFAAAAQGTLPVGSTSVSYQASATLLSMRAITSYGTNVTTVVQTWSITGVGSITGVSSSTVEVSAVLEQQIVPAYTYAAFATNAGCGALSFAGGVHTDSYDSSNMTLVGGYPATDNNGGNVGTNGNLTESGGSIINGSLSTPRAGVGNCKSGAVTALTQNGGATVTGGVVTLPQSVTYPAPALPDPMPPTTVVTVNSSSTCASIGLVAAQCSGGANEFTFNASASAVSLGNVNVVGGATLHLTAGDYNFNSLTLAGGSHLIIDSGPVVLNVAGASIATPVDLTGGTTANTTFDPSLFRIQYAGTGTVMLAGGAHVSATIYAPNASAQLTGGSHFYGSVLAANVDVNGGTYIHYDRRLGQTFYTAGNNMLTSFTWKKF